MTTELHTAWLELGWSAPVSLPSYYYFICSLTTAWAPDRTMAWPRSLLLWQRLFHTAAGPRSWHWAFCPPISLITLITTTLICGPHPSAAVMPVLYQWSVLPLLVALWAEIICNMRNAPWTRDTRGQGARGPGGQMQSRNLNYVFSKPSWVV